MNDNRPSSPLRAARILNATLNVVIAILFVFVAIGILSTIIANFDPDFRARTLEKLNAAGGNVPDAQTLTIWGNLGVIVISSAYLYVAFVIKRIVKTTLEGNPFVDANISRLRKTWIVIAAVEIFKIFVMSIISNSAKQSTALEGFAIETSFPAWFLVFVIAAMAEVFRIGLELRRDQELTV